MNWTTGAAGERHGTSRPVEPTSFLPLAFDEVTPRRLQVAAEEETMTTVEFEASKTAETARTHSITEKSEEKNTSEERGPERADCFLNIRSFRFPIYLAAFGYLDLIDMFEYDEGMPATEL